MSGVGKGGESLEGNGRLQESEPVDSGNYLLYSADPREVALGTGPRPDALLLVNVGGSAVENARRAELTAVETVGVIDVVRSEEGSSWTRIADHFRDYPVAVERTEEPADLDRLGIAINQFLSEHVEGDQRVVVCVDSLSGLLEHNAVEDVFHFLHLLTRLLDSMDGTGYYRVDPGGHDQQQIRTLAELVDGVLEEGSTRPASADAPPAGPSAGGGAVATLVAYAPWLWVLAILTFGLTDIFTTYVGLRTGLAVEASPIASLIFGDHGFGFIYVTKLSLLGLFYLLWRAAPSPFNVGIPIGLFLIGTLITIWNVVVITYSFAS